jgi:hypothetical protein
VGALLNIAQFRKLTALVHDLLWFRAWRLFGHSGNSGRPRKNTDAPSAASHLWPVNPDPIVLKMSNIIHVALQTDRQLLAQFQSAVVIRFNHHQSLKAVTSRSSTL